MLDILNVYLIFFFHTDDWQKLLEECLGHEVPAIKLKAAEAHTSFFIEYYTDIDYDARNAIVNRYLESLRSSNQTIRIGFAQAIGKLKKSHTDTCVTHVQLFNKHIINYLIKSFEAYSCAKHVSCIFLI